MRHFLSLSSSPTSPVMLNTQISPSSQRAHISVPMKTMNSHMRIITNTRNHFHVGVSVHETLPCALKDISFNTRDNRPGVSPCGTKLGSGITVHDSAFTEERETFAPSPNQ